MPVLKTVIRETPISLDIIKPNTYSQLKPHIYLYTTLFGFKKRCFMFYLWTLPYFNNGNRKPFSYFLNGGLGTAATPVALISLQQSATPLFHSIGSNFSDHTRSGNILQMSRRKENFIGFIARMVMQLA